MARELALAVLLLTACRGESKQPPPAPTGAPLAQAAFFRVDATPLPPCTAGAPCEARLQLTALGDYHVNEQYPVKFESDTVPGLSVDGTGTFVRESAKVGTLTIRFVAASPGKAQLKGTFKLSVCTDDNCEIEAPAIAFTVAAS
ncbi:MAG: hypothetical protein KF773_05280 [Deltaproteobacteria bacterium]|nr:hypothetical protein [Deltaproteobacteria bacterium]